MVAAESRGITGDRKGTADIAAIGDFCGSILYQDDPYGKELGSGEKGGAGLCVKDSYEE